MNPEHVFLGLLEPQGMADPYPLYAALHGDQVVVMLAAANRDPRRFADPDVFRPGRPDAGLLSFGAGAHFCLGAALARLEGTVAFGKLLARFPAIAAAGEPERRKGLTFRGFEHLPVKLG